MSIKARIVKAPEYLLKFFKVVLKAAPRNAEEII
jgi:hypothetical protein